MSAKKERPPMCKIGNRKKATTDMITRKHNIIPAGFCQAEVPNG